MSAERPLALHAMRISASYETAAYRVVVAVDRRDELSIELWIGSACVAYMSAARHRCDVYSEPGSLYVGSCWIAITPEHARAIAERFRLPLDPELGGAA